MTPQEELALFEEHHQVIPSAALYKRARGWYREKVVATSGCFDILHAGHVRFLREAANLGTLLVVCLNSDESIRRLKGPGRPIVPLRDRVEVLCGLWMVNYITVFDGDTPIQPIDAIHPQVWVKAGDYQHKELPERTMVEHHGGIVRILPYHAGHSTTALWARLEGAGS